MTLQNKRLIGIFCTATLLLLIPIIAMLFTDDVSWSIFDFALAATLLYGTGLLCELVLRNFKKTGVRIAICAVMLTALILIWIELAVGLFGTAIGGQ